MLEIFGSKRFISADPIISRVRGCGITRLGALQGSGDGCILHVAGSPIGR